MGNKGGGKSQAQLDARSRSLNPQDIVGQAALSNQGAQHRPGTPAFQAIQDNRSVQLNVSPDKRTKGGSASSNETDDSAPIDAIPIDEE